MVGKLNIAVVREKNSVRTLFQSIFKLDSGVRQLCATGFPSMQITYKRDDFRGLRGEFVCELFIEGNEIVDVDVAKVLL